MNLLALEKVAEDATRKVSDLVPNSYVVNDGGGAYLFIPLVEDNSEYLIVAVPVLFNGLEAQWVAHYGDHSKDWETDFTVNTDAETVAEWVNSVVLAEAKK